MKKRKKSSRHRGTTTHGRGAMKKARGKGHRGGVGMAGTGKRADTKKTKIISNVNKYFKKVIALRAPKRKKPKAITLAVIQTTLPALIKKGKAEKSKEGYELNLIGYKIIGNTDVNVKLKIKATSVSKSAAEKIKQAGGSIELEKKKEPKKPEPKAKEEKEDNKSE